MNLLGIFLLAISLSIDALGIGVSYGLRKIKVPTTAKLIICFISILFSFCAILIGKLILNIVPISFAKIIGAIMLIFLGIFIILQPLKKNPKQNNKSLKILNQIGITTKIMQNPISCDFNNSKHIEPIEAIYLGVALSIDSFGAGVLSCIAGLSSFFIPIVIGLFQLIFLIIGSFLGQKISLTSKVNSELFVIISGILLIVIAIVRLFI